MEIFAPKVLFSIGTLATFVAMKTLAKTVEYFGKSKSKSTLPVRPTESYESAEEVADAIKQLVGNTKPQATSDVNYQWARYVIDSDLLSKAEEDVNAQDEELYKELKSIFKPPNETKLYADFKPDIAWEIYKSFGGDRKEILVNLLAKSDAMTKFANMYPWLVLLAESDTDLIKAALEKTEEFSETLTNEYERHAFSELHKYVKTLSDEQKQIRFITSLQDKTGAQVDFSLNPKALFSPPRPIDKIALGSLDLGVLGDVYICGLNSHRRRVWVLLPSCLQRFAYKKIFSDNEEILHHRTNEMRRDNIRNEMAEAILY